jgi:hypothetical protein
MVGRSGDKRREVIQQLRDLCVQRGVIDREARRVNIGL